MADDSEITTKGDKLLASLSSPARHDIFTEAGSRQQGSLQQGSLPEGLAPELAEELAQRADELARIRAGLLQVGVSESVLDDPESAEISHLTADEQEEYNDAVREHRELLAESERDLRELREDRAKAGINYGASGGGEF